MESTIINSKVIKELEYKNRIDIKNLYIGKDVEEIGAEAFSLCHNLESIEVDDNNKRFGSFNSNCIVDLKTGALILGCKNTVIPNSVSLIAPFAFCGQINLESIRIPSNITKVCSYAFDGCLNAKTLVIDEGLVEINENAFRGCLSLEVIKIPSTINKIEKFAFGYSREYCLSKLFDTNGKSINYQLSDLEKGPLNIKEIHFNLEKSCVMKICDFNELFCVNLITQSHDLLIICKDRTIIFEKIN